MQINTKRRWVKRSHYWDCIEGLAAKKAVYYLNKTANRKFRKAFRNIPTRELLEYENEIQGGLNDWWM